MKYIAQISLLKNCPPAAYKKMELVAYRFVFDKENAALNFTPLAIKEPTKLGILNDAQKCLSYGLSFFDSAANAETKFKDLKRRTPQIHKKIGSFLAAVPITPRHGLVSQPNGLGHFTIHEFPEAVWEWNVVKELK